MTTTKLNGAQVPREVLTAARTYYVRANGNDTFTGLTNVSGTSNGAFLTVQKAIDVASTLDNNGYDITIQIADGTYSPATTTSLKSCVGEGYIIIQGNTGTPANVVINYAASQYGFRGISVKTKYKIKGIKLVGAATSESAISAEYGTYIEIQDINFGAGSSSLYVIQAIWQGMIQITGALTISGNVYIFASARGGGVVFCVSQTITVSGTPAFSFLFTTYYSGTIIMIATFSGAATGAKYLCSLNGVIYSVGITFPTGMSAGSVDTGGQFA